MYLFLKLVFKILYNMTIRNSKESWNQAEESVGKTNLTIGSGFGEEFSKDKNFRQKAGQFLVSAHLSNTVRLQRGQIQMVLKH